MNSKNVLRPLTPKFGLRDLMILTMTVAFACLSFLALPALLTLVFLLVTLACIGIGAALRTGSHDAFLFAILGGIVGCLICETLFGAPFPYGPSQSMSNLYIVCGGTVGAYFRSIVKFKRKEIE